MFRLLFRIEVAIKEASSPLVRDEMLDEAKAMVRVSKHDHIVNIQGSFKVIPPKLYKKMFMFWHTHLIVYILPNF